MSIKTPDLSLIDEITDTKSVRLFFDLLMEIGLNFNPDNRFEDYVYTLSNARVFTDEACIPLNASLDKCFEICQAENVDIHEIAMEAAKPYLPKGFGEDLEDCECEV